MKSQLRPQKSTAARPSAGHVLPGLFAEQARRTPDAIAVETADERIDYRTLDRRADALAARLAARGVGAGAPVAVCLPRGADVVSALLAVWRVGAMYVPLDPAHPRERLAWLLEATAAPLVLTDRATRAVLPQDAPAGCLDEDWPTDGDATPVAPFPVGPLDAAYVIFTSGSTGRPKGVVVPHEGIANRVGWTVRRHGLGPGDRILQKTTLSFDAAGWEIFAPLVSGATVVMAPPGTERDPALMVATVAERRITVLQVVPSVLRLLTEQPAWERLDTLRLLFCAGEPLRAELLRKLPAGLANGVWNTYGPTECSIDVTAQEVDLDQADGPVPIGRPIEGMRVLVLDTAGEPVPIGVPGELYAGGPGVALGYLNRPDLTAERFVPDPYGRPGGRLYRTGDLVRWRPDRTLEYLGRLDQQTKVNGVRIEPGEIEAALATHPGLHAAAVTVATGPDGAVRLVAHVRPQAERIGSAELRTFLRDRLPEAMVPALYRSVERFPLTASGKTDRRALAAEAAADIARPAFVLPAGAAERAVAEAWAALLPAEAIGRDDDFFQLGGSSILFTRLLALLRDRSEREIDLRELFTATTVREQALLLAPDRGRHTAITPVPRTGPLPLSPAQQRFWFLDRMDPGSPEWVTPLLVRLPADVTEERLRAALAALAGRHEILRTRYLTVDGEPRQLADLPAEARLTVRETGPDGVADLLAERLAEGFDLERGPVWRALLLKVAGQRPLLVVTIHHIASDGRSSVVLERDLLDLCAGREPAEPPIQYADFAAWQNRRLTPELVRPQLDFWRERLAGLEPLELPADRPRPAVRDSRGGVVEFSVPEDLTGRLRALSRRRGTTPFMTLLAAYAVALARHTGREDIAVGTPVLGRSRPEAADVVGCFLNNLVLRCDLAGDPTFDELLDRVRETSLAALAHQDLPFERLVEELSPERDTSRTPLHQVAFDFQDEGATGTALDDADLAALTAGWRVAKTDLTLFVQHTVGGGLRGQVEFATALFDRVSVEGFAGRFVRLLEGLVADPSVRVSSVGLLSAGELAVVAPGAALRGGVVAGRLLHEVFEERVAESPSSVAVVAGGVELSYGEVNVRANRLAHLLRELGVGAESPVGVCLGRGVDLVPSLLGVLKSGAAYVPLDPAHPVERRGFVLGDTGASVVVTSSEFVDELSGVFSGRLVVVDEGLPVRVGWDADPVAVGSPEGLAYVIYTSGSTGRPKGVCVSHASVWRLSVVTRGQYGFGASDVWPLFHSYAFDVSVWEMWGALLNGGRLVVVPFEVARSPEDFLDLLVEHRVTVLNQTPSAFRALVTAAGEGDERIGRLAVRVVVFAGERLEFGELRPWVERLGLECPALVNMYGITETTVHSTYYRVTEEDLSGTGNPVGVPLGDLRIYVLDRFGEIAPPGVVGEMYVGGPGVARGYLGRPALTAERFVPDRFGPAGGRLYRSGDLARRMADGSLEFVGRIDDQVKIRGYRIELGEIAAVIAQDEAVRDAVVLAREDVPGERRLVAYVVPAGTGSDGVRLRARVAEQLPPYMVPAAFVELEAFPLTANGKLDKRALPVPDGRALALGGEFVAPDGPVEELVAAVWADVLGVERVGAHDNFFDLGGNSLLALRLVSQVQEAIDIDLPVRQVFDQPTVARMADQVEARLRAELSHGGSAVNGNGTKDVEETNA
ncbi:amino acid adenylation domain-containing protein [Kitasatospora sp. NPDC097691]|uniref:amino acid adenylation domain-containing protein n=1 Tax=Kitasatospora sp. NPDC097691 TaxID=3157231 RepID=UPI00332FB92C